MTSAELLTDAFGRVREELHATVDSLNEDQLAERLDQEANSIAWLCWHLTRVQDDHIADAFGVSQVWMRAEWEPWVERFALAAADHGYGHSPEQVGRVQAPAEMLTAYHDAVYEQTIEVVSKITDEDLPRIVDERWDPPVTLGARLISVVSDCLQHVGQAAFVRGILLRR